MISKISVAQGPWCVAPVNGDVQGCYEIVTEDNDVISMAHEFHNAVMMACSKEMFETLIDIKEILDQVEDNDVKESILDRMALTFEKVVAEADV